eukprot:m.58121 g.58121  ORF g.58121 m.58121 type:complete len:64 (+) comp12159_c0_seq2:1116-1307(+)
MNRNDFTGALAGTTVDYLFHSPALMPVSVLCLHNAASIKRWGGLPGPALPSDHQPLLACMKWV